jgi:hypothetical protein
VVQVHNCDSDDDDEDADDDDDADEKAATLKVKDPSDAY